MKISYCFALFFFSSFFSNAQDCEVQEALLQNYQKDVSHLAVVYLEDINAPEANHAIIPETALTKIWSDLAAIFNSDLAERDEVFDAYCIHHETSDSKINQHLYVNVDENTSWYNNWMNDDITTNISEIDAFFQRYNFELNGTLGATFKIKTEDLYNLQPLVDTIATFDGVNFSEIAPYIGDGNRIVRSTDDELEIYDFYLRWGDCPSGCIWWHSWSFSVDDNCTVSFLGNDWNNVDMPDPVNCNISMISAVQNIDESIDISFLPNPAMDYININIQKENAGLEQFMIYNSLGNLVSSGNVQSQLQLAIHDWSNGVYYFKIGSYNGAYRFVKL